MNSRTRLWRSAILMNTALSTALVLGAGTSSTALAQTTAKPAPQASNELVDEIVVTGSRIVREGYDAPTPLAVISAEQLESSSDTNMANYLAAQPVFTGNSTSRNNTYAGATGSVGVNTLNLRSLGGRTLILLDGRRVEPATAAGAVDVSSLPQQLMSRVDVVTGGASAVYGSDAVAGVVNFVLDKQLTGVRGEISGGVTTYGDNESYAAELATGIPFHGGRGHILLSGEIFHAEKIPERSRDWWAGSTHILTNPAYTATSGLPANLFLPYSAYATGTPGGIVLNAAGALITTGPLARIAFGENGVPYTIGTYGTIVGTNGFAQGGDYLTNEQRGTWLAPEEARKNLFANVSYDISDNVTLNLQYSWSHSFIYTNVGPVFRQGPSGPLVTSDNPFMPATVRAAMAAAGVTSVRIGSFNQDLGWVYLEANRYSRRYLASLEGQFDAFGSGWNWEASYQRGEAKIKQYTPGNISIPNYLAAVDVVANPVSGAAECRSLATNPNCRPWNVMGTHVNDPDGAAARFIHHPSNSNQVIIQDIVGASFSGEPFSLWAGTVSVAGDIEHRRNSIDMIRDDLSAGALNLFNNTPLMVGSTHVTEGALETVIPLANGEAWAANWDFSGAVRYTSYNIAGDVITWKVGSTYSPVDDLKIRATLSRDISAPNAQQNFDTGAVTRSNVNDLKYNNSPIVQVTNRGNLNLKPEDAKNFSIGAVLQPSWVEGFSVSVDYWSVNIHDVISSLGAATVIAYCVNGTRPDLCPNVTRDPVTDFVTEVRTGQFNFAYQRTRGVDLEGSYRTTLDRVVSGVPGEFSLHGNMAIFLEQITDTGLAGVVPIDSVGELSGSNLPKWRLNATTSYTLDGARIGLTARAFPSGKMFANYIECTTGCPASTAANPTINDNYLPGRFYLDMSMSYDIDMGPASGTVFLNVKNLLDKDPPLTNGQIFFSPPTSRFIYDVDGRVFRAGIRFRT